MNKFRWAYIGAGNIAYSTARSILKGDHEITAVYNRTYKKACKGMSGGEVCLWHKV